MNKVDFKKQIQSYWRPRDSGQLRIPVARPQLPLADQVEPYLRRIDAARWYSNGGPLVQEFEDRIAMTIGNERAAVATVTNATIGLTLALLSYDLPPGSLCMLPAWTFAATAHAVLAAGLKPWIVDVDRDSWALGPEAARQLLLEALGLVTAVVPVSPFGAPQGCEGWSRFQEDTGVKVVIDAAAAFDSVRANSLPQVVSLHATKVIGVGEGGFVISTNSSYVDEIRKRANFGFWNSREATALSGNGKMSEYSAAVGLAALDLWPETRAQFCKVAHTYAKGLAESDRLSLQEGWGDRWISSTAMIQSRESDVEMLAARLAAQGIGTRRWWGGGLHRHRAFAHFPCAATVNTEALSDSILGLPCACDLTVSEINEVCEWIGRAV